MNVTGNRRKLGYSYLEPMPTIWLVICYASQANLKGIYLKQTITLSILCINMKSMDNRKAKFREMSSKAAISPDRRHQCQFTSPPCSLFKFLFWFFSREKKWKKRKKKKRTPTQWWAYQLHSSPPRHIFCLFLVSLILSFFFFTLTCAYNSNGQIITYKHKKNSSSSLKTWNEFVPRFFLYLKKKRKKRRRNEYNFVNYSSCFGNIFTILLAVRKIPCLIKVS